MKIAFITDSIPSQWGSCRIISPNLLRAYNLSNLGEHQFFSYNQKLSHLDIFKLATEIQDFNPDKIIFVDHAPHPIKLLIALDSIGLRKWPRLFFHIYGDLTYYASQWSNVASILTGKNVTWIVASKRQGQLLQTLFHTDKSSIQICPFPVREDIYFPDQNDRNLCRRKLGISDDEFVLLYTGRMSLQKNVLSLLKEFSLFVQNNIHLNVSIIFAGEFDDIGAPFFGIRLERDQFKNAWLQYLHSLPIEIQRRVHFVGGKNNTELVSLYRAADLFVSLSTHHDEDFGMSPAEALMTGCPALLTNWGGFAGFQLDDTYCKLIPISLMQSGPQIHYDAFHANLTEMIHANKTDHKRKNISELYAKFFSVNSAKDKLKRILSQENRSYFSHLNDSGSELAHRIQKFPENIFLNEFDERSLYFRIYQNYTFDHARPTKE